MSTLNKAMKKVSSIRLMTSAGTGIATTYKTKDSTGRIDGDLYFGFKQPASDSNAFQVQYRRRYVYTKANTTKANGGYTAWSEYMNARQFTKSGTVHKVGQKQSAFAVNSWDMANLPRTTSGTYRTVQGLNLNGTAVGSNYIGIQYQLRVRTYNKTKKQHGEFVYSKVLSIWKPVYMRDEAIHVRPDGGIYMEMNLKRNDGGTFHLTKLVDANGVNIVKAGVEKSVSVDKYRSASTVPPLRDGYTAGSVAIKSSKLTREVVPGETLKVTAWYESGTIDNLRTYWKDTYPATQVVSNAEVDRTQVPSLSVTKSSAIGIVNVTVRKGTVSDEPKAVSCTATYTDKSGNSVTIEPQWSEVEKSGGKEVRFADGGYKKFYFVAPINVDVTVTASVSCPTKTHVHKASATVRLKNDRAFFLNSMSTRLRAACLVGNWDIRESFKGKSTIQETFGRSIPFAIFGTSRTHELTLSGSTIEDWKRVSAFNLEYNTYDKWKNIANHPGTYLLRTPDGGMYNVAVSDVSISRDNLKHADVQVTMTEVS